MTDETDLPTAARSAAPDATTNTPADAEGLLRCLGLASTAAPRAAGPPPAEVPGFGGLEELGRGGMGVVYKARQERLNRTVALKMVLRGAHLTATDRARFLAEAEAVAAIKHPHVVQVFEFGERGGQPYFAMEFLGGGTLAGRLKDAGQLPPADAAAVVEKIARGVQAAHEAGIVHRDLKPANVLLDAGGEPKVADFGLAKRGQADLTDTNAVMGTPAYMSPEQAGGRAKFVGPAADVWALGVILYECLTGTVPFRGGDAWGVLQAVQNDDPDPTDRLAPGVPRDLDLVCRKCLEKDPRRRYAAAADLADDLARFRAGESVTVRAPGRVERVARWSRRYPARAAAVGLGTAAVLLAGLVVGTTGLWRRAEAARADAVRVRDDLAEANARLGAAVAGEQAATREAREARAALGRVAGPRQAQMAYWELAGGRAALAREALAACPPEYREWERRYAEQLCSVAPAATFSGHAGRVLGGGFSPDGRRVVTADISGKVVVWDPGSGRVVRELGPHAAPCINALFLPTGDRVVTADGDRCAKVWDAATGELVKRAGVHQAAITGLAVRGDGRAVFTSSRDGTAVLWDLDTGRPLAGPLAHPDQVTAAAVDPSGEVLATGGADGVVRVWSGRTGAKVCDLTGHTDDVVTVAVSPDGKWVASASEGSTVRLWDVAARKLVWSESTKPGKPWTVEFARDGSQLVVAGPGRKVEVWATANRAKLRRFYGSTADALAAAAGPDGRLLVCNRDGSARVWAAAAARPVPLVGHEAQLTGVAVAPDGTAVTGSEDGTCRTWSADGTARRVLDCGSPVWGVSLSRDGGRLAAACGDGRVRVWDPLAGTLLFALDAHKGKATCAAFTPDGRELVTGGEDAVAVVWGLSDRAPRVTLAGHGRAVWAVDVAGGLVATASYDSTAAVWDAATGRRVSTLRGHDRRVLTVAFSPGGQAVATGGDDRVIRVWEPRTGRLAAELDTGNTKEIWSVQYRPDGRRLAAGSNDGSVNLWDLDARVPVLRISDSLRGVTAVAFAPDGETLLTGSADHVGRLHTANPPPR